MLITMNNALALRTFSLLAFITTLLLSACSNEPSHLQKVKANGELVVITRNSATTYYEGPNGPTGMEYDLVKGFANELGVQIRLIVAPTLSEVLSNLVNGEGDLAAAGLTITEERQKIMRFAPPYQTITQQMIYKLGEGRPNTIEDVEGSLEVVKDSSHAALLKQLQPQYPNLTWTESYELDSEELLTLVWEKVIDYTVSDSNEFQLNQRFYPELRNAFDISEPESLAWAFTQGKDQSLYGAAIAYFNRIKKDGTLEQLLDRYYGHVQSFDYVGTRTYMRHILKRLPKYRKLFEYTAEEFGLDWRFLAAMSYQESHWNAKAVSPTGVRGLMMLTQATAEYIGVKKRTDPAQSIRGGAMYYKKLLKKFDNKIPMPDQTWFAVASYNIGYLHIIDAIQLTEMRGGDTKSWKDLRENLPLLRKRKWYKQLKRGYARGNEAVKYTENIRSYYDILVWLTERNKPQKAVPSTALEITTPTL
jgi:membrane-bound lytic murein transglycosylase F